MTLNTFIDRFHKPISLFLLIGCGFLPLALWAVLVEVLRSLIYNGYGFIAFIGATVLLFKAATKTIETLYALYSNIGGARLQAELKQLRAENLQLKTTLDSAEASIEKLHHLAIEKEKETARAQSWVVLNDLLKSGELVEKSGKVVQIDSPSHSGYARQMKAIAVRTGQLTKWKANNNTSMVQVAWLLENGYRVGEGFEEFYQQDENQGFTPFVGGL